MHLPKCHCHTEDRKYFFWLSSLNTNCGNQDLSSIVVCLKLPHSSDSSSWVSIMLFQFCFCRENIDITYIQLLITILANDIWYFMIELLFVTWKVCLEITKLCLQLSDSMYLVGSSKIARCHSTNKLRSLSTRSFTLTDQQTYRKLKRLVLEIVI